MWININHSEFKALISAGCSASREVNGKGSDSVWHDPGGYRVARMTVEIVYNDHGTGVCDIGYFKWVV